MIEIAGHITTSETTVIGAVGFIVLIVLGAVVPLLAAKRYVARLLRRVSAENPGSKIFYAMNPGVGDCALLLDDARVRVVRLRNRALVVDWAKSQLLSVQERRVGIGMRSRVGLRIEAGNREAPAFIEIYFPKGLGFTSSVEVARAVSDALGHNQP